MEGAIIGYIDRVLDRRITGWVLDRDHADQPVEVEIMLDGVPIARARADRFRKDLAQNGIGSGHHAFDIQVDQPLPLSQKHRVAAYGIVSASGQRFELINREVPRPKDGTGTANAVGAAGAGATSAVVPEGLSRWLEDFRSVQVVLENALVNTVKQVREAGVARLKEIDQDMKRAGEAVERLHASQQALNRQIETLEVVQARIDQALAGIQRIEAKEPIRDAAERWLKRTVALLAIVSITSLVLGVRALLE